MLPNRAKLVAMHLVINVSAITAEEKTSGQLLRQVHWRL